MSSTLKLYYQDSHMSEFDAVVVSCNQTAKGYAAVLDKTAFFPEGGGQRADTGLIGDAVVYDVHEKDGIYHYIDRYIEPGTLVHCRLDFEKRFRRMQNHSGEHIVSGLVHSRFGYDNVGFHLGEGYMTIDFNGELDPEELESVEKAANAAVFANVAVKTWFPEPETLSGMEYRSKLELTENVRLVEIEGFDVCACCAPHVSFTGEIGIIKILDCERHRGGMRLTAACGMDAFEALSGMQKSATEISGILSAKRNEISDAVKRLLAEKDSLKYDLVTLGNDCAGMLSKNAENRCLFFSLMPDASARELINRLKESFGGVFGVFIGDDEKGYKYYIGSSGVNLKEQGKAINASIEGRGGGTSTMITGMSSANREKIVSFFNEINQKF